MRPKLIEKDENDLTEEEKQHNKKVMEKQENNKKRKIVDAENRARDKFFASVMKTYLPNISEIIEQSDVEELTDKED
jgi:ribosomal protein S20